MSQINREWSVKNIRSRNSKENIDMYVKYFFNSIPLEEKEKLSKQEMRNFILTSDNELEHVTVSVYESGIKFKLEGCRAKYSIFCNFDGEIKKHIRLNEKDVLKVFLYSHYK